MTLFTGKIQWEKKKKMPARETLIYLSCGRKISTLREENFEDRDSPKKGSDMQSTRLTKVDL